jgi:ribose transport system substrate-binding protein
MKPLRLLTCLGLALAGALLPSCQTNSGKPKVCFVSNNAHEFWSIVERGGQEAADKEGVELVFRKPAKANAAEQKAIIDTELAKGVKAISISVIDPDNQKDYLNSIAKRVPLLAVDNDAEETDRRCYLGTDNIKGGHEVGKLIKEAMPDGGVIALFVGQIEPINARERIQGVLNELGIKGMASADGKYRLHSKDAFTDDGKRDVAKERAATVLAQLENEKNVCVVGLWAYNPPEILAAAKAVKREGKVKIVGFDEEDDTLRGIEDGYIYGTVVQNPYQFGYQSVKMMAKMARNESVDIPESKKIDIPVRIVTKDGGEGRLKATDFIKEMDKLLGRTK